MTPGEPGTHRGATVPAVDAEREQVLTDIDGATERLLRTVRGFSDADVRAPSLLPGWTRAHVLAHLVGGAGALRNLLDSARTGVALAAYASQQARDDAIEAGSRQDVATLLGEVAAAAAQFRAAATAMPEAAWAREVQTPTGATIPAVELLERRLVELELHHTDLDAGYGPGDWPPSFAERELAEPMRGQRSERAGWAADR
jgi:maleylpyruvate isomerase